MPSPGNADAGTDDDEEDSDSDNPVFEPFKDLCKQRFLWYYESYTIAIDEAEQKNNNSAGKRFEKMPFEGPGNTMDGRFNFAELRQRIENIKNAINNETADWAVEGLKAKSKETRMASNLQRQYEQVAEDLKARKTLTVDVSLENENPFVWKLVYFGRPMTQLDGVILEIRIALSPRFPDEQPRVVVQTPIFHNRIAKDGVLCYFPRKVEDMKSHLEAIVNALEDESPPYDPRTTVNPEASKLLWGSADDKKKYNRTLRRSVQRLME